jgi:hypothetical protein
MQYAQMPHNPSTGPARKAAQAGNFKRYAAPNDERYSSDKRLFSVTN